MFMLLENSLFFKGDQHKHPSFLTIIFDLSVIAFLKVFDVCGLLLHLNIFFFSVSMKSVTNYHLENGITSIFDTLRSAFVFLLTVYISKFLQQHKT